MMKPKISKRPMSMSMARMVLATSGMAAHENSGPYWPRAGPTLPKAEMVVESASMQGKPQAMMAIQPTSTNIMKLKKNTNTVEISWLSKM